MSTVAVPNPSRRVRPDPLGLELRRPGVARWAAILPNPAPGQGPFKLQYFGLTGLAGHRAYATPQAAEAAARRAGYTEPAPGALARLAASEAWRAAYDTPAAPPPIPAIQRVLRALTRLHRQGVKVATMTFRPHPAPPLIHLTGPRRPSGLDWRPVAWGHDPRGRYRRYAAQYEGCRLVREVRDRAIHLTHRS